MVGTTQSGADPGSDLSRRARNLGTMFVPKSVAIIGASRDTTRIGGRPIQYTLDAGYDGRVYPVNPKYEEVAGLRCYPDLASIPEPVDLCMVAVPARHVLDALHECVEAGVRSVVVFSAGFAEAGEQGQEVQASMRRLARSSGINILGPNCLGVLSYESGLMASFTSSLEAGNVAAGNIGFVCQSGAFGTYFLTLARARNMKFSHWAATGNEVDVSTTDCIAYMALDPATEVIAGYVEGVRDGPRFREALELARDRGKPVILLKAGRSDLGARAAVSHTASMAGNDAVFDAVFERHGVCRAEDTHELLNFAQACSYGALPAGDRVCLVTVSGGVGIMMADRAAEVGLQTPSVPEDIQARMKDRLPYAATMNPVDITAQFINEPDLLETFLDLIVGTGTYDAVLTFLGHTILAESLAARAVPAYIKVAESSNIPLFLSGVTSPRFEEQLHENQLAVLDNPTQAVDTIRALARIGSGLRNGARTRVSGAAHDASEGNLRQVVTGNDGFRVRELQPTMAGPPHVQAVIDFDECAVPAENVVGEEGRGFKIAMSTLAEGRLHVAANELGIAQQALNESIRYAKRRVQFGEAISNFQAIRHKIADMATEVYASRQMLHAACRTYDQGQDIGKESSMVKLFVTEAAGRVVDEAVQIHGGKGYMWGEPVERMYRDVRLLRIVEGSSEIQKNIIAREVLEERPPRAKEADHKSG